MKIEHTDKNITVSFSYPLRILSSAVYNGGLYRAKNIINLKVNSKDILNNNPEKIIIDFINENRINGKCIGLLTSAEMKYAHLVFIKEEGIKILAIVTAGASNALNISERSITNFNGTPILKYGTINIIVITNVNLLSDGMVSSIITATEAKTAALFDLKIKSILTGNQATGTGTDSIVIVSGNGENIQYCGGHTLYGQLLGEAVYTGIKRSLSKRITKFIDLEDLYSEFDF